MSVQDIKLHSTDVTCGKLEGSSAVAMDVVDCSSASGAMDVLNDYGALLVHEAGI